MIPEIWFIDDIVFSVQQSTDDNKTIIKTTKGHKFNAGKFTKSVLESVGKTCLFEIEAHYFRNDYKRIPSLTISDGLLLDFMSF